MNAFRVVLFAGLSMLLWSSPPLWAADFEIDNYTLVSSTRVTRTVYEYTYKADVGNWSGADTSITATVTSTAPHIIVVENSLSFGDVPDGATVESTDTFIVRLDRSKPFDEKALVWTVQATPLPPTTFALIDPALASGAIDAETALVYKVYSEFNDARLPPQYRGRDDQFFEATATKEARRLFDTLSPATQQILAPLLQLPGFSGVAASPQIASASVVGAIPVASAITNFGELEIVPGIVIVRWDADSVLAAANAEWANRIKAEVQANIWPKLTGFLGTPTTLNKILILLEEGTGKSEESTTDCVTAEIRLRHAQYVVLAHELTHALIDLNYPGQCNVREFLWMHEATATWAQHYVYPNDNGEHGTAPFFLRAPEVQLNEFEPSGQHQYGAYLWFFHLAGQGNDPAVVGAIWDATASEFPYASSLDAIEAALQGSGFGGFDAEWPRFVLDNWNRVAATGKPYRNYFMWDKLRHRAKEAFPVKPSLQGATSQNLSIGYSLPRLSATYRRYDFTTDPNIRTILFTNANAGTKPTASIHAIVKVKGKDWQPAEDWSNEKEKWYCRDKAEEDIEHVILVIANRGFRPSDPEPIEDEGGFALYYSALPCHDWTGSVTYRSESSGAPGYSEVLTATGSNLRFHVDLTQNRAVWLATEGIVNWNLHSVGPFEDGSCTGTASGSFAAKDKGQFFLNPAGNTLQLLGGYTAFLPSPPTATQSITCTSSSGSFSYTVDAPFFGIPWFDTGPAPWPVALGATAIQGSYSPPPTGNVTDTWTWNFSKAP